MEDRDDAGSRDPRHEDPDREPERDPDEPDPKCDPDKEFDEERWRKRRERHRRKVEKGIRDAWGRQDDDDRGRYTPWLVIRYGSGDFGLRPIPDGVNFWKSPDLWVESSDPSGKAVAGEQNFVWVRIFNLGMAPSAPIQVDFYWANPALGLGAANMNLIGTEWTDVPSQFFREIRCNTPWVPVFVNNGHECLKVNCTDPIRDPITAPFQPKLDRHVGQRNITVLAGAAGTTLSFQLELNNLLPLATRVAVFAGGRLMRVNAAMADDLDTRRLVNQLVEVGAHLPTPMQMLSQFRPGTAQYRNASIAARLAGRAEGGVDPQRHIRVLRSAPRLAGSLSQARTLLLADTADEAFAKLLSARGKQGLGSCRGGPSLHKLEEITMQALEGRRLDVELGVPSDARPGDFVVFNLEQWAEGMSLGGYDVVVRVIEEAEAGRPVLRA